MLTCTSHAPVSAFIDVHVIVQVDHDSTAVGLVVKRDLLMEIKLKNIFIDLSLTFACHFIYTTSQKLGVCKV